MQIVNVKRKASNVQHQAPRGMWTVLDWLHVKQLSVTFCEAQQTRSSFPKRCFFFYHFLFYFTLLPSEA